MGLAIALAAKLPSKQTVIVQSEVNNNYVRGDYNSQLLLTTNNYFMQTREARQTQAKLHTICIKFSLPPSSSRLWDISSVCVSFLANVKSRSRSLYAVARTSVVWLSVCNVRAPYSAGWNFRQCFCAIWYLDHPLTSTENFTEIVSGEPLRRRGG